MEYLEWAALQNQLSHLAAMRTNSDQLHLMMHQSSFLLLLYFATWSRSKLYALAFLFVDIYAKLISVSFLSVEHYGFQYYSLMTSLDCILFALILTTTNSKSQRIICGMMVTLDVLMAIGYLVGGDAALFIYDNYENIVFCLHVMLILSLYRPKPILRALADKFLDFFRAVDSIIFMRAFWYTKEISKQEFKLS